MNPTEMIVHHIIELLATGDINLSTPKAKQVNVSRKCHNLQLQWQKDIITIDNRINLIEQFVLPKTIFMLICISFKLKALDSLTF